LKRFFDNDYKKASFLFMLIFGASVIDDINVFTLNIPVANQLNISEGEIAFKDGNKYGRMLIINPHKDQSELSFNCHIYHADNCIPKSDEYLYINKNARVWWYETKFSFRHVKRLLQLEVDGKKVINYQDQKEKYLKSKAEHDYISSLIFLASLTFFLALQIFKSNSKGDQYE